MWSDGAYPFMLVSKDEEVARRYVCMCPCVYSHIYVDGSTQVCMSVSM